MKFLCVPCDSPMKLQTVGPPDRGSLSIVYACPECGYEMAMLTNAYETQVVTSLGVRIGPDSAAGAATSASASALGASGAGVSAGTGTGCPFTAMIPSADGAGAPVGLQVPMPVRWTAAAEARLANIPAFVRPMARTGIERFARERGALEVDERILDAAREFFGM
jgi:hypothetical protein